jgi:hypothetical protein
MDKLFMLPSKAAEKDGGPVTLGFCKGVLNGSVKLLGHALFDASFLLESPALLFEALADQRLSRGDLNQSPTNGGNFVDGTNAHSSPRFKDPWQEIGNANWLGDMGQEGPRKSRHGPRASPAAKWISVQPCAERTHTTTRRPPVYGPRACQ